MISSGRIIEIAALITKGSLRPIMCLIPLVVFAGNYHARQQSGAVIAPPRAGLVPVHRPDLERLEPDVRDHLASIQDSFNVVKDDHSTTNEKLGESYGLLGQVYQAYSLGSPAEECYLNAHTLVPKDFRWVHLLGRICQQEARADDAIRYYKLVRQLRPDYPAAAVNLGNLYLQQNRVDEARESFKDALAISADSAAALYGLGQVSLSARHYAEAAGYFNRALQGAPDANRIHYALAMAYRGLGDIQKAQAHIERQGPVGVRVSDPLVDGLQELIRGERVHLLRGRLAFDALRFSEAANEFRKAVAAKPDSIPARVNLGSALAQTGEIKAAIEQFQQALRIDPGNAASHYNLGFLCARQNQHEQAIIHLRSALDLNPKDDGARFLLARELVKTKRQVEALAEYSRVVESNPGNEDALLEQVELLLGRKEHRRAIERLEKGNALFPQNGRTAITLAYLLAGSQEYDLRDGAKALALSRLVYQVDRLSQSRGGSGDGAGRAWSVQRRGRVATTDDRPRRAPGKT